MSFSRSEQLSKLENQEVFDLLILGGGIVGSAALAMASAEGLNSILLEKMILLLVHRAEVQNSYTVVLDICHNFNLD